MKIQYSFPELVLPPESELVSLEEVRKLCELVLGGQLKANHVSELQLEYISIERATVAMKMPFQERLVGNPSNGVMHGGAITTLLDTCCGSAALSVLSELSFAPTLDLRVDYLSRGDNSSDIFAHAEVYKMTKNIIFTRGVAYQQQEKPVATVHANFSRLSAEHTVAMQSSIRAILEKGAV